MVTTIQLFFLFADCTNRNAIKKYYHCGLYNPQLLFSAPFTLRVVQTTSINFSKYIAICITHNAFKKNLYCELYNPQCIYKFFCIAVCTTRNAFKIFLICVVTLIPSNHVIK